MKPEPLTKEKIKSKYDEVTRKLLENLLHELDEEGRRFDLRTFKFEDVKSAVQFYLRYKDNPVLLLKEYETLGYELKKIFGFEKLCNLQEFMKIREEYNDWLFKKAFSGVVEE